MQKFVILAGTVPIYNGKILIIQRSFKSKFLPGIWTLPCGKVDFGEDIEITALRELKEETGATGVIKKIIGTSKFIGTKDGIDLHNAQVNFLVELNHDNIQIDDSSETYDWIPIEDFESSKLDDYNKSIIRKIFDEIRQI